MTLLERSAGAGRTQQVRVSPRQKISHTGPLAGLGRDS